jgi:hypothetical protein
MFCGISFIFVQAGKHRREIICPEDQEYIATATSIMFV